MTKWNCLQRKLSWQLIALTSHRLNSDIMKTGGTAFTLMHHHYSQAAGNHHKIYKLIVSTLFIGGKLEDDFHSLKDVLKSFQTSVESMSKTLNNLDVKSILEIDQNENLVINQALTAEVWQIEITLLKFMNWSVTIDSPFKHVDNTMININENDKHSFYEILILVIASIMQSKLYIKIPFDIIVAAALSIAYSVFKYAIPLSANVWIEKQQKNNTIAFEYSLSHGKKFIECCMNAGGTLSL